MMANGKKNALLPDVYRIQTSRKCSTSGTATLRYPLKYADKPEKLELDNNWGGSEVTRFSYTRYELYEYFTGLAGEQAGMYVFYNNDDELIASIDKRYVDVSSAAEVFSLA